MNKEKENNLKLKCGCPKVPDFNDPNFPLDCPLVFEIIKKSPFGVFQLEGAAAGKWIRDFEPSSLQEISDFTSLARPGPLESGMMEEYIKAKKTGEINYIHEDLIEILEKTKGCLVYQESVMEICKKMASMSLQDADKVRKAVGKKKPEEIAAMKSIFLNGCSKNNYSREVSETVWSWIEKHAGYSFNLSHAISYSKIAYFTAWCKAHFPLEFFTALLRKSDSGNKEQVEQINLIANDAKLFGIKLAPPDIRKMNIDFEILDSSTISFGLKHIKGIGESSISDIKKCNVSSYNELKMVLINDKPKKTVVEALLWGGAFDFLDISRYQIYSDFFLIQNLTENEKRGVKYFGLTDLVKSTIKTMKVDKAIETDDGLIKPINKRRKEKLSKIIEEYKKIRSSSNFLATLSREKFYLGITISGSEADLYENNNYNRCIDFTELDDGSKIKIIGYIEKIKYHIDRNKNKMAFMSISDSSYMLNNCVVFASTFAKVKNLLSEGNVLLFSGKKQKNSFIIWNVDYI